MKCKNFLFEVVGEDSANEGEEFFVYAENIERAAEIVKENFPNEEIAFRGRYSDFEAEMCGFDTYS